MKDIRSSVSYLIITGLLLLVFVSMINIPIASANPGTTTLESFDSYSAWTPSYSGDSYGIALDTTWKVEGTASTYIWSSRSSNNSQSAIIVSNSKYNFVGYDNITVTVKGYVSSSQDQNRTAYYYFDISLNGSSWTNLWTTSITAGGYSSTTFGPTTVSVSLSSYQDLYYVRFRETGTYYSTVQFWMDFLYENASNPNPPTSLLCEGIVNPSNVTTSTPSFSAIGISPIGLPMNRYEIQIAWDNTFSVTSYDSGKTAIVTFPSGSRCSDITYPGYPTLVNDTTYYWRIKFWDNNGREGDWSTETAVFKVTYTPAPDITEYIPQLMAVVFCLCFSIVGKGIGGGKDITIPLLLFEMGVFIMWIGGLFSSQIVILSMAILVIVLIHRYTAGRK